MSSSSRPKSGKYKQSRKSLYAGLKSRNKSISQVYFRITRLNLAKIDACVEWISRHVASFSADDAASLFKTAPRNALLNELKKRMRKLPSTSSMEAPFDVLLDFSVDMEDSFEMANVVLSLLKYYLRELERPLLSFEFCIEDLMKRETYSECDDDDRGAIGARLGRELILQMSAVHRHVTDDELVVKAISCTAKLFAMLCQVERADSQGVSALSLVIPFLPSLAGCRGLMVSEAEAEEELQALGKISGALQSSKPPPKSQIRMERMIQFGTRVYGYVTQLEDSLADVFREIRDQLEEEEAAEGQQKLKNTRSKLMRRNLAKKEKTMTKKGQSEDAVARAKSMKLLRKKSSGKSVSFKQESSQGRDSDLRAEPEHANLRKLRQIQRSDSAQIAVDDEALELHTLSKEYSQARVGVITSLGYDTRAALRSLKLNKGDVNAAASDIVGDTNQRIRAESKGVSREALPGYDVPISGGPDEDDLEKQFEAEDARHRAENERHRLQAQGSTRFAAPDDWGLMVFHDDDQAGGSPVKKDSLAKSGRDLLRRSLDR